MKKTKIAIFLAFTMVFGSILISGIGNQTVLAETEEKATISVSGEAVIKAVPDIAYIKIGVETESEDSEYAQEENKQKMNKVMSALEKFKIDKKDIKTVEYGIYPLRKYDKETGKSNVYAYKVSNIVEITIRDIDITGKLIDEVTKNGSNTIKNISFGLSEKDEYYIKALKEAVKIAKTKANAIAETIEVKIDKPKKITEDYVSFSSVRSDAMMYKAEASYDSTPVSQGEVEIKARVSVIYEY